MGFYARHNVWYDECCKGKYKFDEESTGDAGRDLCDVCDMPLPSKDIEIGAERPKPEKPNAVTVKAATNPPKEEVVENVNQKAAAPKPTAKKAAGEKAK